eukprot:scaffold4740_cov165-Amphora_coffeaeformis.AAC.13
MLLRTPVLAEPPPPQYATHDQTSPSGLTSANQSTAKRGKESWSMRHGGCKPCGIMNTRRTSNDDASAEGFCRWCGGSVCGDVMRRV